MAAMTRKARAQRRDLAAWRALRNAETDLRLVREEAERKIEAAEANVRTLRVAAAEATAELKAAQRAEGG